MDRFELFRLENKQFVTTNSKYNTLSEAILHANLQSLDKWAVYDTQDKIVAKINLVETSFKVEKPFIRIAGQKIKEGAQVTIPAGMTLIRASTEIDFWNQEMVEDYIQKGYLRKNEKPSRPTFLNICKILQINSQDVIMEGIQISCSTLKYETSDMIGKVYEDSLVPLNFKKTKIKISRDKNKMLFI